MLLAVAAVLCSEDAAGVGVCFVVVAPDSGLAKRSSTSCSSSSPSASAAVSGWTLSLAMSGGLSIVVYIQLLDVSFRRMVVRPPEFGLFCLQ